eukprot:gene16845-34977_t
MPEDSIKPQTSDAFLPFALPDIGDEEIAAVVDCLRSGWVTTGPKTREFEADFAAYLGGGIHTVSVNSATAGLHLALEALGIGPGDEVIVPTLTFTATAEVVRYLGAQPVFVDVDPDTLNLDLAAVEAAIGPHTRAIMPVHYAGLACDMDGILQLARTYGLKVVEDAAHAFPTRYKGRLVGTLGSDVTVFSFYANKTMTTGEGGMVVTRDAELAKRIAIMRIHGISQDAFARYTSRKPAWFYEVVAAGFKYNLTDAVGTVPINTLLGALCHDDATMAFASNPFCTQIRRDATGTNGGAVVGGVTEVVLVNQNVASTKVEGYDYAIAYGFRTEDLFGKDYGSIALRVDATWMYQFAQQGLPGQAYVQFANTITNATPEWKGNASVRWTYDKFSFGWSTLYFGSMIISQAQQLGVLAPYKTGDYVRHDARVSYKLNDDVSFRAGMIIVFDRN